MPTNPNSPPVDQLLANLDGVRRLAGALVRDPHDADDLAQEAVLAALESPPRPGWDLRAWLGGVVRNKARRLKRSARRRHRREERAARHESVPSAADVTASMAEQRRVMDAVTRLTPAQQQMIWLRYFEDLPPRVIALRLDVPVETVRTRTKRALARLRHRLDDEHGGRRGAWVIALMPLAGVGGASSPATRIGGALMSAKQKLLGAALVLTVVALGLYSLLSAGRSPEGGEEHAATTPSAAEGAAATLRTREGKAPRAETPARPDARGTWRFPVVVTDGALEPLEGAEVRIGRVGELSWERLPLAGATDPAGRFEAALDAEAGPVRVVALAPGRLPVAKSASPGATGPVRFRLLPVRMLHFVVRDGDTGEPLEGVHCESFGAEGGFEVVSRSTTDGAGRAAVRDSSAHGLDRHRRLRFRKPGYVPRATLDRKLLSDGAATPERPREIYLFKGHVLRLRVVDARGRPVPGAEVTAWSGSSQSMPSLVFGPLAPDHSYAESIALGRAPTDDAGIATLGVPLEGWNAWFAVARTEGHAGYALRNRFDGKKEVEAEIVLHETCRIEGRVVDENDRPVEGAEVGYGIHALVKGVDPNRSVPGAPPELAASTKTVSDGEGRFVLERVPVPEGTPKGLPLFAMRAGFDHVVEHVQPPAAGVAALEPRIVMKVARDLVRVRVRNERGDAIAGAWVTWRNMRPHARTDAEGRAALARLPGATLPLTVSAPGYGLWMADAASLPEAVEVTLGAGRTLTGRVENADGSPAAAFVDIFRPETAELPDAEREKMQIYGRTWITRAHAATNGQFYVRDLPAGAIFLRAFRWATGQAGGPTVAKGEGLFGPGDDVVVRLSQAAPSPGDGRSVSGSVRGPNGERQTRYNIQLRVRSPADGRGRSLAPVQKGWSFRFEAVPPGRYELLVTEPRGAWSGRKRVEVVRGRDIGSLVVSVVASGVLAGRIELPEGAEMSAIGVAAHAVGVGDGARGYGTVDCEGRFRIERLEPGRYELRLRGTDATAAQWQAAGEVHVVRSGTETEAIVRAVPAGRIVLVLDDERFAASANAAHLVRDQKRGRNTFATRITVTSPSGAKRTRTGLLHGRHAQPWALPAGTYRLRIDGGELGAFETTVTVRKHADTEVVVRLEE